MGKTNIGWTEQTWNPIVGCTVLTPGCKRCYAMKMAARIVAMNPNSHYAGTVEDSKAGAVWTGKLAVAPDKIFLAPLRRKTPTMYFVNSMGDAFHEDCKIEWIERVLAVMALTPQHTYQVLTKRAARMQQIMSWEHTPTRVSREMFDLMGVEWMKKNRPEFFDEYGYATRPVAWPLENVWCGVSAERQQEYDDRKELLRLTPAVVHFFSFEPQLGEIRPDYLGEWGIVGGESGPNARPFDIDWARILVKTYQRERVPVFMKQLGTNPVSEGRPMHGGGNGRGKHDRIDAWPPELRVQEFPKQPMLATTD